MRKLTLILSMLVLLTGNLIAQVQPLKKVNPSELQPVFIKCGDTVELSNGWVVFIPTNNCPELTVQQRLNAGETPKQIYDSGIPLDSLYGKTYQEGLIFFLHPPSGAGLVAAPYDQDYLGDFNREWGCFATVITGADDTAIGTGSQNTTDIEAGCSTSGIAADLCANLTIGIYSDWFLPSKAELNQMFINLQRRGCSDNVFPNATSPCLTKVGGFANGYYWSSSEYFFNSIIAWGLNFSNGFQNGYVKYLTYRVRAVRTFEEYSLCNDGIQNGNETGIDCGGTFCAACPTCNDGIQNGDETGVDCGGTSCVSCATLCSDGMQNGDETGVDCGGTSCAACPTVQHRLNTGETPKQIYDSGIPLDSLYGKTYQGGLIFFLFPGNGAGAVAAPYDQGNAQWGCSGTYMGAYGTMIGTGAQNTLDIVAGCSTPGIAAEICNNLVLGGYSDWFLPSKNELTKLRENLYLNGLGGFTGSYWSSTESSSNGLSAWRMTFSSGVRFPDAKANVRLVRAVRAF